ncbi:alpha/beta hydrolase [Sphingobium sp. TB-6]|nr:alpha/beta hydrolase [Sphingobium sp. TB-6]
MTIFTRREFGTISGLAMLSSLKLGVLTDAQASAASPSATPFVDPELMRALQAFQQNPAIANASPPEWVERKIPGPAGAPDVRVYILNGGKANGTARPAILHMHGGGYTMGSALMSMPQLSLIGAALDCMIMTVDYRLAPGTPFPGSLEDNYAALKWLHKNAAALGADSSRIAVMGESAGGGHAAMLAIAARDRGEIPILFQALIYPMLDDRTGTTRQVPSHIGSLVWTAEQNRAGWTAFLGMPAGGKEVPPGSVPSRIENLGGLPQTFIVVGAIDLFLEEDIVYAQRLLEIGVPVELVVIPGAFHGFDFIAPQAAITKRLQAATMQALRRAFERAA